MTEITIDLERAKELLEDVVKGNEDFVYSPPLDDEGGKKGCKYEAGGKPSCMVGVALFNAGVTVRELSNMDSRQGTIIGIVRLPERVRLTDDARQYFASAQSVQDCFRTWGEALDSANRYYDRFSKYEGLAG